MATSNTFTIVRETIADQVVLRVTEANVTGAQEWLTAVPAGFGPLLVLEWQFEVTNASARIPVVASGPQAVVARIVDPASVVRDICGVGQLFSSFEGTNAYQAAAHGSPDNPVRMEETEKFYTQGPDLGAAGGQSDCWLWVKVRRLRAPIRSL